MQKKNRYLYYSILPCCIFLIAIGVYVTGYNPPTQGPPFGNLPAPINASLDEQTKAGNLTIDGLLKIGRYTSAPTGSTGALYYDTTENAFKGYKAAAWADLGGTAPVSSVFGRTGAIVATTGDYTVSKITGAAPLASPTFTGTVTAPTFSGALNGNATTATKLQTARTINGVSFDGSANITIPVPTSPACTLCYSCGGGWPNTGAQLGGQMYLSKGYGADCGGNYQTLTQYTNLYLCCR